MFTRIIYADRYITLPCTQLSIGFGIEIVILQRDHAAINANGIIRRARVNYMVTRVYIS